MDFRGNRSASLLVDDGAVAESQLGGQKEGEHGPDERAHGRDQFAHKKNIDFPFQPAVLGQKLLHDGCSNRYYTVHSV